MIDNLRDSLEPEIANFLLDKDTLFHYTRKEIFIENILKDFKLKFSTVENYSDIREKKIFESGFRSLGTHEENIKTLKKLRKKLRSDIYNYKVCSFCCNAKKIETNIDPINEIQLNEHYLISHDIVLPGYFKDRMWDIYSGKYSGVCLVFDKNRLIERIKKQVKDLYSNHVNYCRIPSHYYESADLVDLDKDSENIITNKLFTKHIDYSDENEFRIVLYRKTKEDVYLDIKDSLRYVILGPDFPKIYHHILKRFKHNITYLEYYMSESWQDLIVHADL